MLCLMVESDDNVVFMVDEGRLCCVYGIMLCSVNAVSLW